MNASDHAPAGQSDVLRSAWKRMVELDRQSSKVSKQSTQLRRWIAILGVVATFLAIVTNEFSDDVQPWFAQVMRVALIAVPIVISVIAAFSNKFFGGSNGLVMRAGSEEIKKEIFLYRTVLRNHPDRDRWLSRRLTTIQRRTYKSLGGELIIEPYEGKLPPYYNPDDPNSDPGFNDLTGDEYMTYRVIDQRDWHRRKNVQLKAERLRIQFYILFMGGLGAFLAALPPEWGLAAWVALTAAVASALTGWEQLRGLDKIVTIYSRVILELTIIRDEWEAIPPDERTEPDFVNMIRAAEDVMWAQNMQYISTMQEAITSGQGDEAELVENMLKESDAMAIDLQTKLLAEAKGVLAKASTELGKVVEDSAATVKGMVSTVATTATHLQEKVKDTVVEEVAAFEETVESGLARVSTETAAVRATVTQTVTNVADEVAETRELVEAATQAATAEAAALRQTAQTTVDTALSETAATRAAIESTTATVAAQAGAMRETVEMTITEQAAATRETVDATAETLSTEAAAMRETVEMTIIEQAAATRETVDVTAETLSAEAAAMRETVATTVTEQAAATRMTVDVTAETLGQTAAHLSSEIQGAVQEAKPGTSVDEIREIMEEKIVEQVKKQKKDNDKLNEHLDQMLDEAAEVIETATDAMREKMAEEVAQKIVETATDTKKKKSK